MHFYCLLQETTELKDKSIHYFKLHAPWNVLCFYAEDLLMKVPLEVKF